MSGPKKTASRAVVGNAECTKSSESYVEKRIRDRVTTYSVLMNGQWYSQGEMGWFGMSTDTLTDDEWSAKVADLIDSLPQDTRLTLVDVHI